MNGKLGARRISIFPFRLGQSLSHFPKENALQPRLKGVRAAFFSNCFPAIASHYPIIYDIARLPAASLWQDVGMKR